MLGIPRVRIEPGHTDHVTYTGKRVRRPTILIRFGTLSFSKKAFLLGVLLALCQILDGLLTYIGLSLMGTHIEGNAFLKELMYAYGTAPVLFATKVISLVCVMLLTIPSHRRRWLRGVIGILCAVYLGLAVIPWMYLISAHS